VRTHDHKALDGSLLGFEAENAALTRSRACRIAASIPGATIVRRSRLFRDSDDFCEFTIEGETFIIEEPFSDNSRYWIGPKGSEQSKSLLMVREAFERYTNWHVGYLILVLVMLVFTALLGHRCSVFLDQDSCLDRSGSWDRIQRICNSDTQK
jgi:hypothetical protein